MKLVKGAGKSEAGKSEGFMELVKVTPERLREGHGLARQARRAI